jgi:hypothetical protein
VQDPVSASGRRCRRQTQRCRIKAVSYAAWEIAWPARCGLAGPRRGQSAAAPIGQGTRRERYYRPLRLPSNTEGWDSRPPGNGTQAIERQSPDLTWLLHLSRPGADRNSPLQRSSCRIMTRSGGLRKHFVKVYFVTTYNVTSHVERDHSRRMRSSRVSASGRDCLLDARATPENQPIE